MVSPIKNWEWRKFKYTYTLDKPINEIEIAEQAEKLKAVGVPTEVILGLFPFIEDPKKVMEMIKEEREQMGFIAPDLNTEGFDDE